jgi:hypothetical protein
MRIEACGVLARHRYVGVKWQFPSSFPPSLFGGEKIKLGQNWRRA